jgi:hypothetical protein
MIINGGGPYRGQPVPFPRLKLYMVSRQNLPSLHTFF